jgi:phenylacetate-CoA ligase
MTFLYSLYYLCQLQRTQWSGPSEIRELQRRKLRRILDHSYKRVDYYRELIDSAGVRPGEINDPQDLMRIPITTKKDLQALPIEKITARGIRPDQCMKVRTSGSTGIPLDILIGPKDSRFRGAVFHRLLFANGYRLRDKVVAVTNILMKAQTHWYQSLGLRRGVLIDVSQSMDDQIKQLRLTKPDILRGLAESLRVIAETVRERNVEGIHPRMVITGGEGLTEETREVLQDVFGAKVIDTYNCWEFGNIAWECGHQSGYHINTDGLIVEILKDGRRALPGDEGELIITGLNAYAMPLIRYRVGDMGILSGRKCPCGRSLPLLERIAGRTDDLIRLADGRIISPFTISKILRFITGIAQFKMVQERKDAFQILIVRGKGFSPETVETVRREMKKPLGEGVLLDIQLVDHIPLDPSGKIRAVLSRVRP